MTHPNDHLRSEVFCKPEKIQPRPKIKLGSFWSWEGLSQTWKNWFQIWELVSPSLSYEKGLSIPEGLNSYKSSISVTQGISQVWERIHSRVLNLRVTYTSLRRSMYMRLRGSSQAWESPLQAWKCQIQARDLGWRFLFFIEAAKPRGPGRWPGGPNHSCTRRDRTCPPSPG